MKSFQNIFVAILICSLATLGINCSKSTGVNQQQLIGTWVGTYMQLDEKLPRPRVININPDGTYETDIFDYSLFEANWHVDGNTLVFDTTKLNIEQPSANELYITGRVKSYYRKALRQEVAVTDTQLENTAWQSTNPANPYKIYLNYEKMITEYPDGRVEIRCWKLKSNKGLQFFYQQGNPIRCNKLGSRLQQILKLDDQEWVVQNYNAHATDKVTLQKIKYSDQKFEQLRTQKHFQRCSPYSLMSCYNLTNVHQKAGIVKEEYLTKFKPVPGIKTSGILRLRFVLNCQVEIGEISFEGLDTNYKAQAFDKRIKQQLIDITKSMDGWKAFEHDDKQDFDCFTNFIFKFENGKIIDLSL